MRRQEGLQMHRHRRNEVEEGRHQREELSNQSLPHPLHRIGCADEPKINRVN